MMPKVLLTFLFSLSCIYVMSQDITPEEYIDQYKDIAIQEMRRTGVPASITLAQGLLESGNGNSYLVQISNNHFGIKCKANWQGPFVKYDDDSLGECFRAYEDVRDSYIDHSNFLKTQPRYSSLFSLDPQDYKGWAYGLKKAGYATNPLYADLLIKKIQQFSLDTFTIEGLMVGVDHQDYKAMSKKSMLPENMNLFSEQIQNFSLIPMRVNNLMAVSVDSGISLIQIANHFHLPVKKLIEWNEIGNNVVINQPQIIYLQEKNNESKRSTLIFSRDMTLYQIAQSLGVKVTQLCRINNKSPQDIIKQGTVVYMQEKGLKRGQEPQSDENNQARIHKEEDKYHFVQPREGLYSIAKQYGKSVQELKQWNKLNDDNLHVGQKIIIPQ